ncbi:hypothetical protein BGX27_005848 [Mortierella sp. AM989]|nr:hypothetical protein BGX27_005848 [Mortierella sp. AM989]
MAAQSMSHKRPHYFPPPQPQQDDKWLRYPDPEKPSNIHSRTYAPAPLTKSQELSVQTRTSHTQSHGHHGHHASRPETQPVGLHHKRSSSKLHSSNSSNASLPMSLAGSNSSSDSLGHHHPHPQPLRSSNSKPRSLSEELNSAFQSNGSDTNVNSKTTSYPSPITPSDLLGIPDLSASSSSASSSSASPTTLTPAESPLQKADSANRKLKPSPLSINTTPSKNAFEGSAFTFPQGSPTSVRGSTTNSEGYGSPRRYAFPQLQEHDEELSALSPTEAQLDSPQKEMGIEVTPSSVTTAVTIVGSTPAFGISAFREPEVQEHNALGLYTNEPPKKRQRSAAAVLLGAAVETVIFTSAVALSAYQLLTGKGKLQEEDSTMTFAADEAEVLVPESDGVSQSMVAIKSAPVNIPARAGRHRDSSLLGKSLHHNHHARPHHHKSKNSSRSRHGLSSSLPHAYDYDHMKEAMTLPDRPNTGTEDNDEQFLRMEAQLSSLIAEGKRALSSRIPNLNEV